MLAITDKLLPVTDLRECTSPAGLRPVDNTGSRPADDKPYVMANLHGATHNLVSTSYIAECHSVVEIVEAVCMVAPMSGINCAHTSNEMGETADNR